MRIKQRAIFAVMVNFGVNGMTYRLFVGSEYYRY